MSSVLRLSTILAVVLCGAVGVAGHPAVAKKNSGETVSVQKKKKKQSTQAKDCRKGPVPPFMRNPRYMNRGFVKKRC